MLAAAAFPRRDVLTKVLSRLLVGDASSMARRRQAGERSSLVAEAFLRRDAGVESAGDGQQSGWATTSVVPRRAGEQHGLKIDAYITFAFFANVFILLTDFIPRWFKREVSAHFIIGPTPASIQLKLTTKMRTININNNINIIKYKYKYRTIKYKIHKNLFSSQGDCCDTKPSFRTIQWR